VAGRPSLAPLYTFVPDVDAVVTLEWRGMPMRRQEMLMDVQRLRAVDATVGVLFPNSFASAWLAKRAGISERWGYASDLRRPLLTRAVRRPGRSMHQAAYYQSLVRELGVASGPLEARLALPAAIVEAARALLGARGWDGVRPVMAIAPGAAYGTAKRWQPAHFVRLIGSVVRERGVHCVLVGGAADAETTRWIVGSLDRNSRAATVDLAGGTSLQELAGILRLAAVCVSNDSGAMHLAAAVGVPLAALFGPTRERETAPLTAPGGRSEVLIHPVWCRPCMLRECPIDHRCMKGLTPDRVFDAVTRLMDGGAR
jgi:heptosyltransferase-2